MFKLVVFVSLVGAAVSGPIDSNDANELACAEETGSSVPTYQNYYTHHIFDNSDHRLKCMVMCALSKAHVITEDGELDAEKAADRIMETMDSTDVVRDAVVSSLQGCDYTIGDKCDKGFAIGECILSV